MENSNQKNKNYWDKNPMTYKPFGNKFNERILNSKEDFDYLNSCSTIGIVFLFVCHITPLSPHYEFHNQSFLRCIYLFFL